MKNLILTLITTLPLTLWGQGWEQTYGGSSGDYGNSVQQTSDNGYVITGTKYSYISGIVSKNIFLYKTDSYGDTLWTKTYGGIYDDNGKSVDITSDGGYIIVGDIYEISSNSNVFLIKTDEYGDTLWTKTYVSNYGDYGRSVKQTSDGGFIITGYKDYNTSSPQNQDLILIKTNSVGDTLWTKLFTENCEWGHSVQETDDGGYIVIGDTRLNSSSNLPLDILFIKLDSVGNVSWKKIFGSNFYSERGLSGQQTNDGGYIIGGYTSLNGNNMMIMKIDEQGDSLWSNTFGGNLGETCYSIQQTNDNGYILVGYTFTFGSGQNDVYLVKTDSFGNFLWSKTFGGFGSDRGYSVRQTNDGGYVLTGQKNGGSIYLVKTDGYGNILPYESTLSGCDSIQSIINETYFLESGIYVDTLTNVFGGDSVIVQNINIDNSPESSVIEGSTDVFSSTLESYQITINSDYSMWDVDGGTILQNNENTIQVLWGDVGMGYIEITDSNSTGCTTTSTLEVIISNNSPVSNYYLIDCDSVQSIINETYFLESGTYTDTLTNIFDGDSVIVQEIEILISPENIVIEGSTDVFSSTLESYQITINPNNSIEWNVEGETISEVNGNTIEVLWGEEGMGYVEVTETDTNGCSTTSTLEVTISNEPTNIYDYNKTRKLIKTINLLGQEIKPYKNQSYIEIYDDGTRKRKIIIEK